MKKFYLFVMLVLMTAMSLFAQASDGAELCSVTLKKTGYNAYLIPVTLGGLTNGKIKKGDKLSVTVEPKGLFEITISANGNEIQKPKMVASSERLVQEVTITKDTEILVDVQTGVMIDLYVDDDMTSENGSVELEGTVVSGGLKAAHGQKIIVNATPNAGYKVKQIKVTDMATMQELDITDSKTFTANSDAYGVEVWFVSENGGGNEEECSITTATSGPNATYAMVDISEESVKKGESITLTATPMFTAEVLVYINNSKVYGPAIASAEEPLETELTINENANIEVVFNKPATVKLDTDEVPNGTILLNNKELKDVSMGFLHNQEVTVEATADKGYILKSIKVKVKGAADFIDITSEKKFTVSEDDYVLQVNFEQATAKKETLRVYITKDYAKTLVLKDDTGAAITLPEKKIDPSGDAYYDFSLPVGKKYSIEVTAKEGYELKDMDTNFTGMVLNNEFTFNPEDDGRQKYILVNLQPKTMQVKFPKWDHGLVNRKGWHKDVHKMKFGKEYKLDVQPKEGYELESLTIGGKAITEPYKFTVGLDNTIVAKFKKIAPKEELFAVTATAAAGEQADLITVDVTGLTDGKIKKEGVAKLNVSSAFMPMEISVLVDGEVIQEPMMISPTKGYTTDLTITKDTNIEVVAKAGVSMTFEAADTPNGTVEFVGATVMGALINYARGQEVVINTTANEGYKLKSIKIKGLDDSEFTDITESKKFTATQDEYTVEVEFEATDNTTALEALDAEFKLYPNPATDYAIVSGVQAGSMVKLISLTGKTVLVKKADFTGEVKLDLTSLPRGLYVVRTANKVFKLQVQ